MDKFMGTYNGHQIWWDHSKQCYRTEDSQYLYYTLTALYDAIDQNKPNPVNN